jgi:hypothetical protein
VTRDWWGSEYAIRCLRTHWLVSIVDVGWRSAQKSPVAKFFHILIRPYKVAEPSTWWFLVLLTTFNVLILLRSHSTSKVLSGLRLTHLYRIKPVRLMSFRYCIKLSIYYVTYMKSGLYFAFISLAADSENRSRRDSLVSYLCLAGSRDL